MNKVNVNSINVGFGKMADEYDAIRETNIPVKIMREKFYKLVIKMVPPPASMLELNCGSGIDAQFYRSKGYKVLATDISDKMLFNAAGKGSFPNLSFMKLDLHNLEQLNGNKFNIIVSNLGGLNCMDDLSPLSNKINNLLYDNGYFIAAIMPKFSLWEFLLLFKGEFRRAFRRLKKETAANVGNEKVYVKYYSPQKVRNIFSKNFRLIETLALSVLSPPPTAAHWYNSMPFLAETLLKIDETFESFYPYSFLGDFYICVFKKK
jgi:ubiquinone/menaquinone biosynthesis C-methylase UbiE